MGVSRLIQSGDAIEPNEFEFTYTGDYNFKDGAGGTIEIEFLTSGTFKLLKSTPFKPFDLCLVGGGGNGGSGGSGGGGGGGYVENMFDVPIELNKAYTIVIGGSAGDTTGFGYTAKAGKNGKEYYIGGDGGSGGGAGNNSSGSYAGGSGGFNGFDGFDAEESSSTVYKGGKGQHTSTRAFGTGRLLAGGGGGAGAYGGSGGPGGGGHGSNRNGGNGTANTGGGGGAGGSAGLGGSGIVILRRRWNANLTISNTYNYITNNITTA